MPGRLKIQRPSPTTVSFTVSNAPQRSSSLAKILFALQILLRAFLFLCVVVVGITLLRHLVFEGDDGFISWPLVWSSTLGSKLCCLVDSYNPLAVAMVSALVIYCVFRRGYTEESLLVIRGFGIQTSTSSATYLSTAATRFIPTTQIQDIVIHEAFKGFEVRFYLAVIVEGEPNAVVVFPHTLPKREILEQVWRGSRRCLYDAKS
ncbi:unnamed protein product [Penicillium salamii]|uniref:Phosphatidylinositol N-acetylglucosaminyltransferase subunit H conserved domain-containing protein n=1 Tax=Penicillium salamii TaxID=1612424 RepID=A0A9W4NL30_9EURO|nr:unnamed protein product [Penicillium salamii]CAG8237448.1 unnamed protein product [Penicillium salamii]CAG8248240.1 unnamed protein product [Penicillium salamii]CAG8261253.1 unnamed protein product [Penicillium salamii]CAG8270038.1 unnamed protein product [Penicillium salamii]